MVSDQTSAWQIEKGAAEAVSDQAARRQSHLISEHLLTHRGNQPSSRTRKMYLDAVYYLFHERRRRRPLLNQEHGEFDTEDVWRFPEFTQISTLSAPDTHSWD